MTKGIVRPNTVKEFDRVVKIGNKYFTRRNCQRSLQAQIEILEATLDIAQQRVWRRGGELHHLYNNFDETKKYG